MGDTDRRQEIESWGDHGIDNGSLASTKMYYPSERRRDELNMGGRMFLWGAEVDQEKLEVGEEFEFNRLVEYWKPGLHENGVPNEYQDELEFKSAYIFGSQNGLGIKKFAFDFFTATLDFLFNPKTGYFVRKLGTSQSFNITCVSLVMTMPSGWSKHEYAVFQQAADEYNLHSLTMLPESDSMARSWLEGGGMRDWTDFGVRSHLFYYQKLLML